MRALLAVSCVALLLAGCTSSTVQTQATTSAPSDASAIAANLQETMAGVPCQAPVPVNGNSANLKLLAKIEIPDTALGGIHGELDIRGDLAVHARYGGSGFELYDIHDPLAPAYLGNWTHLVNGEEVQDGALDVKFSPDNHTVLVGVKDAIHLVDVRDPLHPVQVGDWLAADAAPATGPAGRIEYNSHMLYTKRIGGQDWVFLAPNANSGIWILKLTGGPDHPKLTYVTQSLPVEGGPIGPHDLYVQKDGLDGHWYLYSSDGFHGWTAFNVDDPSHPLVAGGFVNPAEGAYTHTIQAQAIGGKRIVATIAEIGADFLRIYDATNLVSPTLLGVWQAETTANGATAPEHNPAATSPQHNFNIVAGQLYLANYGHGMYIFNLTAFTKGSSMPLAQQTSLKPVAHWAVGTERIQENFTGYWDALVKDGVVYISHIEGGLIVLGYGCNHAPNMALQSDG